MKVTDLYNPNWAKENYALAKDMVDFGISIARTNLQRYKDINSTYRSYHEHYSPKELEEMAAVHGQTSGTPIAPFYKPKTKIDQLLGESLEVGFSAEVDTINPTELAAKKKDYMRNIGRSINRDLIKNIRNQGFDIYSGVRIPNFDDPKLRDPAAYRTRNEMISQRILNAKIKDMVEKNLYYYLFGSQIFTSEIFSFINRDELGRTTMDYIPPEKMIYLDNDDDLTLERTPIIGYWKNMYFPEIIETFKLKKGSRQYREVENLFGVVQGNSAGEIKYYNLIDNGDAIENFDSPTIRMGNGLMATVFYFQWRYYKEVVVEIDGGEIVRTVNMRDTRQRTLVKENPDKFDKRWFENIYQGASISGNVYLGFGDVENPILVPDSEGKYRAYYDFTCSLSRTFGNERTSFAKVLVELGKQYNKARWMLMREAKKLKSNAIYLDEDYMQEKSANSILYELEDAGVARISSKKAFDLTGESLTDGKRVVGMLASGSTSSVISDLINICMDIERAIDSTSSINDARKGTEKATATATTATNNLRASRSATYDNFFFAENHIQRAASKLIQKTKGEIIRGSREAYAYLGEDDIAYIENSSKFLLDDFRARIVGGRAHQEIIRDLSQILTNEVAAGKRSSADYAEIRQQDSLQEIVRILRDSDEKMAKIDQQNKMQQIQEQNQVKKEMNAATNAAREDQQQHEKELHQMDNEAKHEDTALKVDAEAAKGNGQLDTILGELLTSMNKSKEKNND